MDFFAGLPGWVFDLLPFVPMLALVIPIAMLFAWSRFMHREEGVLTVMTKQGIPLTVLVSRLWGVVQVWSGKKRLLSKMILSRKQREGKIQLKNGEIVTISYANKNISFLPAVLVSVVDSTGHKLGTKEFVAKRKGLAMAGIVGYFVLLAGCFALSHFATPPLTEIAIRYQRQEKFSRLLDDMMSVDVQQESYTIAEKSNTVRATVISQYESGGGVTRSGSWAVRVDGEGDGYTVKGEAGADWTYQHKQLFMRSHDGAMIFTYPDVAPLHFSYTNVANKWVNVYDEPSSKKRETLFAQDVLLRAQAGSILGMHAPVGNFTDKQKAEIRETVRQYKPYTIESVSSSIERSQGSLYKVTIRPDAYAHVRRAVLALQGYSEKEIDWLATPFKDRPYTLYLYTDKKGDHEQIKEYYIETTGKPMVLTNEYIKVSQGAAVANRPSVQELRPTITTAAYETSLRDQLRAWGLSEDLIDQTLEGMSFHQV